MQAFGSLNSVIANAGIHRSNTLLDITDEELDLMIQTNIYGTVNTLREAVPHLIEAGGGTVVINASDQWFVGKAHSFAYGLTKGALGQITRSLSIDLGPKNIRVNAVCAGTIHTPLVDNLFQKFAEVNHCSIDDYWREENALYARGSVGKPEEVAEMIYFHLFPGIRCFQFLHRRPLPGRRRVSCTLIPRRKDFKITDGETPHRPHTDAGETAPSSRIFSVFSPFFPRFGTEKTQEKFREHPGEGGSLPVVCMRSVRSLPLEKPITVFPRGDNFYCIKKRQISLLLPSDDKSPQVSFVGVVALV